LELLTLSAVSPGTIKIEAVNLLSIKGSVVILQRYLNCGITHRRTNWLDGAGSGGYAVIPPIQMDDGSVSPPPYGIAHFHVNEDDMKSPVLIAFISFSTFIGASCSTAPRPDLYGIPAPPASATRTIIIAPDTSLVNVRDYETVRFLVADKSFVWHFDPAPRLDQLHLNWIAPPDVLDHDVRVIVATDPRKTQR
jgi:hypothetical protein